MKKIKSILALLMLGGLVVTGCEKKNNKSEEPSQQQGDQGGQQGGDQGGDQTPAHVHNFVFNSFVWTETPGAYSAKAKYVCAEDSAEELRDATVTELSRVGATCTEAGSITWKASFDGHEENKVENIAALGHDMTHHNEQSASCTEAGVKEYWTCSREPGVLYKNELGTETFANSDELVINAIGHDMVHHDAVASNCTEEGSKEYWTCSREPGVLYKNELGTEIFANADELTVAALGHDMTHFSESDSTCLVHGMYECWRCERCHKFFLDEQGTNEVQEEETWKPFAAHDMTHHAEQPASCTDPGVKEYWTCSYEAGVYYKNEEGTEKYNSADELVISALGHDMTHHVAQDSTCTLEGNLEYWSCDECGKLFLDEDGVSETDLASVTVAMKPHNYQNSLVTDKIGYFEEKCSVCGASNGLSSDLMDYADIDFTLAQYGAHGGKWDTNVQPTTKGMTFEVTDGNEENEIFLPKINFSLYKVVKFSFAGNDWSARVGLETGSYAFPYAYRAEPYSGLLTLVTKGSQVNATLTCAEGTTQNLVITDSDILNGDKSVSLFMIADTAYRSISAELTMLTDECTHNFVVSSAKLGAEVCSICGDERDYPNSMVEVDFTAKQYGAHGGKWDTNVQPTEKTMKYEVTAGDTEDVVYLPKINFKAFPVVKFNVTCGSFAIGAGLESGIYVLPGSANSGDPAHTGLLTLKYNGSSLNATLTCKETSTDQQVSYTDADVINGDASLVLYMYSVSYAWQELTIELIALDDSCVHNFVADPDCLGKEQCSVCGDIRGVEPVVDFATNGIYGMYDWYKSFGAPDAGWVLNVVADGMDFYTYNAGVYAEVCLPRIYFAGFSDVSIDLTIQNAGEKYSFESDLSDPFTVPSGSYAAKLVFSDINGSSMTVSLEDSSNNVLLTKVITDANVINGIDGFKFYDEGVGLGTEHLGNFTFGL